MNNELLIKLFSSVAVSKGAAKKPIPPALLKALNLEVADQGYSLSAGILNRIETMERADFDVCRTELLQTIATVRGSHVTHRALYNKFPYDTPDTYEYMYKRLLGYLENAVGYKPNVDFEVLSCGHIVDLRMFPDLKNFSACPICQQQVDELDADPQVLHDFARKTPLKLLTVIDERGLGKKAAAMLSRQSSLSKDERAFLEGVVNSPTLILQTLKEDIPSKVFKETLPIFYKVYGADATAERVSSCTDVMRIAYYLSNPESDLSLKENVKFSLSTSEKKGLLAMLNKTSNLEEDMMRNRERWLRFGEHVHPGSAKFKKQYPKVAKAFNKLRNNPGKINTFNRTIEKGIRSRNVNKDFVTVLAQRPGEFARKLDFMLRNVTRSTTVLTQLRNNVLPELRKDMLFTLQKYLQHRKAIGNTGTRTFIPKGQVNKIQTAPDQRDTIKDEWLDKAVDSIEDELKSRLKVGRTKQKIYVDPALQTLLVPFNKRGDSSTSSAVVKGSQYPLTAKDVVRLFVYWKANSDVDLSMNLYDPNFVLQESIGYYNLQGRGTGCVHSGDIRRAPKGASEFIDFDINTLRSRGIAYVVSSITLFEGGSGFDFPCFAGFMERDALKSGEHYEPASVALKFDLKCESHSHMPLIFDLVNRRVIFADMAMGGAAYSNMQGSNNKFVASTRALLDLVNTKPTLYDVLYKHAKYGNKLVKDAADADVIYKANDSKLLELAEKVMSEE
jgi:hypothetical protein